MINNINWYPGHMKKTRELIQENLKAVDLVVEIVDSRIPLSSRNPIIDELISGKKRVVILGKCDLADKRVTDEWKAYFESSGDIALPVDSRNGENIKAFYKILDKLQQERNKERSLRRPLRMMIVGVPNVGKSSFINRLIGKKSAKTGDRPGVTKGKQWVTLENGMQLLDTPGILWPKFEDPHVGLNLAFCGSIKDEILNVQDLAYELLKVLRKNYPEELIARYKLDGLMSDDEEGYNEYGEPLDPVLFDMEAIALKRGFIQSGKRIDYERTGRAILDEFRAGIIGNITLERPVLK
ncbi:MAG: ribosome biogenesis GTPase YlqF [Mogibacterium diversum]|jgi:ribosome biogenesis GTP-binding protein ylqF|uniref:ribosome biogenesis GTPase YlqF n=1 Tax=Mogibacterium diversum TaxID=114527 RepID=UPI00206AB7C5|nr:ribosome biogenesis GTPase YlqF [Mogibacterium diversum]UQF80800.1 MAG: ribosome biogenesis GTPase YlqF [Mogibacterium diversum]